MISPSNYFRFESKGSGSVEGPFIFEWKVPERLPYFDGHFPDQPTLPGVAMLDGTIEGVKQLLGLDTLSLEKVLSAKFMSQVMPGMTVQIHLHKLDDQNWKAKWLSAPSETATRPLCELRFRIRFN